MGAQNRLLMSTHNIGFYEDLTKLSLNYHQILTLFLLLSSGDTGTGPWFKIPFYRLEKPGIPLTTRRLLGEKLNHCTMQASVTVN